MTLTRYAEARLFGAPLYQQLAIFLVSSAALLIIKSDVLAISSCIALVILRTVFTPVHANADSKAATAYPESSSQVDSNTPSQETPVAAQKTWDE
jgi:hypothetical protein